MSKKHAWIVLASVALLIFGWFAFFSKPNAPVAEGDRREQSEAQLLPQAQSSETTLVSARPTIERSDGYVGSDSCKKCHEDYYQSWHTSFHRTMTQEVSTNTFPSGTIGKTVNLMGQRYKFTSRDDKVFVELNDPVADGKRLTRQLVLMTGSHHAHVFWYDAGHEGTPAQMQIMYLIKEKRWIPRKSFFLRPPNMEKENELGRWNGICCNCHATHPRTRPEENKQDWDTRISDFGITCEACHGPGESHVAFHALDADAQKGANDPIVNPLDLPVERRSDMCGQCHGMMIVSIDNAEEQEKYFNEGRQFRPGERLDDAKYLRIVRATKEHWESETFQKFDAIPGVFDGHFWPDGEMRVTGRDYTSMIESKCFKEGELSCFSCHTMHQQDSELRAQWRDDQLKPEMRTDAACLQCHPKYKELGSKHTHHPIDSHGSRCMNCHMPHTIYGIQKTSRTHTITSPSVAVELETGRPNACNLCHLDYTLAETANKLTKWYGHPLPELNNIQKTTANSIVHLLVGDASQRVLQFNAFQWKPAQEISGTDWMQFYFLLGMEDEYDAIRLISERGYKSIPTFPKINYDFLASPQQRAATFSKEYRNIMMRKWNVDEALLITPDGRLDQTRLQSLMRQRNRRSVYLQE